MSTLHQRPFRKAPLGMDRSRPVWDLDSSAWYTAIGVHASETGELVGFPRIRILAGTTGGAKQKVLALFSVSESMLGLTDRFLFLVDNANLDSFASTSLHRWGDFKLQYDNATQPALDAPFAGFIPTLQYADLPEPRWAVVVFGGKAYFCNLYNHLQVTDGQRLIDPTGDLPAGMYMEEFFDHLVVGHAYFKGTYYPDRVMWSELNKFTSWSPHRTNEADHYDMLHQQGDDVIRGVTGMAKLGDRLIIYSPNRIYAMSYIGLPAIMHTQVVFNGRSCDSHWCVVNCNGFHMYPSFRDQDFYIYDGINPPKSVGKPIAAYLWGTQQLPFEFGGTDYPRHQMHGYHDPDFNECVWWLRTAPSGASLFKEALVYNYKFNTWTIRRAGLPIYCFAPSLVGDQTIGSAIGDMNRVAPKTLKGATIHRERRIYGCAYGLLATDFNTDSMAVDTYMMESHIQLETGIFPYDSLMDKKDIQTLVLDADHSLNDLVLGKPAISIDMQGYLNLSDVLTDYTSYPLDAWYVGRKTPVSTRKGVFRGIKFTFQPKVEAAATYTATKDWLDVDIDATVTPVFAVPSVWPLPYTDYDPTTVPAHSNIVTVEGRLWIKAFPHPPYNYTSFNEALQSIYPSNALDALNWEKAGLLAKAQVDAPGFVVHGYYWDATSATSVKYNDNDFYWYTQNGTTLWGTSDDDVYNLDGITYFRMVLIGYVP